ncbi:fluoride efflux transporter CrcB [Pseudonocardia sp. KRD291]|uniref:fluoride efflux transporter CrcB n=1 Tax=Pseudonocardia sp. KRD291 TaxID=2792007 RepID=UPI001C4A6394|nr:fluoride efflux transporter CrcB [Pseudonocardia sp. KRD291]MBW0106460.1 fluoride efflux transporter CrcB [Pseudonocardia sp. KRD291]
MSVLWVALGAAVGAPLRYLTDRAVQSRHASAFPWGTLTVNVAGSFVLGVVVAAAAVLGPVTQAVVGTGFCGALSTYSTFSYETFSLTGRGRSLVALAYVVGSVLAGLGAAAAGFVIGRLLL